MAVNKDKKKAFILQAAIVGTLFELFVGLRILNLIMHFVLSIPHIVISCASQLTHAVGI